MNIDTRPQVNQRGRRGKKNRGRKCVVNCNNDNDQQKSSNIELTGFGSDSKNNQNSNGNNRSRNNQNKRNRNRNNRQKKVVAPIVPEPKSEEAKIEDTANEKSSQLDQIYSMFGDIIEKPIINDYWNMLNFNYEKTIVTLSEMVEDIERQKRDEQQQYVQCQEENKKEVEEPVSPKSAEGESDEYSNMKFKFLEPGSDESSDDGEDEKSENPFKNAFHNYEYQEPNEEEIKASQEVVDQYMAEAAREEQEWFIQQEKDLLQQLMDDFQLEEYLGEGTVDEETMKAIYDGDVGDTKKEDSNDLFFSEKMFNSVDDEVRPFAEDPSLQLLIQYQIQAEQEQKAMAEYQFDQQEFPSLINDDKLKEIIRKKTFKLSDWKKAKTSGTNLSGDALENEAIEKIKKAFPLLNTDIIKMAYMQLGDAQYVLDYLKIVYDNMYNNSHVDVRQRDIAPIKSKIPNPPAFGPEPKPGFKPSKSKKNRHNNRQFIENNVNYDAVREQEKEYCRLMRQHFEMAAKAFKRGDGATAKRESQKGKQYKMMYLNEKRLAIERTLASKNGILNRNECIDLHGLHENEVEYVLDDFIGTLKNKLDSAMIQPNKGARGHVVTVITGKGNNSKNNKSVVKKQVKQYLKNAGLGFREGENGGYYTVSIL